MEVQEHKRGLGSRLTPLQVRLVDDDDEAVDLTSFSVTFYMSDEEGNSVVSGGSCTIQDALEGLVAYSFAANDVDEVGVYWGYFRVFAAGSPEIFDVYPTGRLLRIEIFEVS